MLSIFIKEQYPYSREDLLSKFAKNDSISCIKKLKEYGILKTIKKQDFEDFSNLNDEDYIVIDEEDKETKRFYLFNFVGIIIVNGILLKCYPKYISKNDEPINELKLILKVLEKYNTKEQIIKMHINCNSNSSKFNRLAAIIGLLNDYYNNGLYSNTEDIIETNGNGEIHWDKTINETFALLQNRQPCYIDLKTKKRREDDQYYIKRLHECILTNCCNELNKASLSELLNIENLCLSEDKLEDFGDKEYILNQLQKEMNIQFNTRKQAVLQMLYLFVENQGSLLEKSCFTLYGTNSYHMVWEAVCAKILNNQFNKELKDEIAKNTAPIWVDKDNGCHLGHSLVPDIVSIFDSQFIIFDAKYYNLMLEKNKLMKNNPGVGDVMKQYLYQLAFNEYVQKHSYKSVKNCFLMPTDKNAIEKYGYVSMNMLQNLGLETIQIRLLPANQVYNMYLRNQKLDISCLNL